MSVDTSGGPSSLSQAPHAYGARDSDRQGGATPPGGFVLAEHDIMRTTAC